MHCLKCNSFLNPSFENANKLWVLRTDWKKKKKKSEGWWIHNWMSRVLWFMNLTENFSLCLSGPLSKKSWGGAVTATSRLDEGKMNVLHSLYWPWSRSSLLTRPIFRRISPLKKKKVMCRKSKQKLGKLFSYSFKMSRKANICSMPLVRMNKKACLF